MTSTGFTPKDFEIFDIDDFEGRMAAIRERIRPKLQELGRTLAPELFHLLGQPVFEHVAKHARRTVNPPDDTWVAFCTDKRGYKKHPHFKVAVSRNCLRFLFEIGPENRAKDAWARAWKRQGNEAATAIRNVRIGWFKNEHDEDPAAEMKDLSREELLRIGDHLVRTRDGQLVVGRRIPVSEATKLDAPRLKRAALDAFATLAPLFHLK